MFFRAVSTVTVLFVLTLPASGLNIYPLAAEPLQKAAARYKDKDYKGAHEAALLAPKGAVRAFVIGMSAARLQQWEESAANLGEASEGFTLLADYALYHQANALHKLNRHAEALIPLRKLLKEYPESPLIRGAMMLLADTLYGSGDFKGALLAYGQFMEKYAAGADAITALYRSALCRDQLGDLDGAVQILRNIRLNNPASPLAITATEDMQKLALKGAKIAPFTPAELFHQGTTLFDLGNYSQAIKTFGSIPQEGLSEEFITRLRIKTGQAQFKARRYSEAEQTFSTILTRKLKKETSDEVTFWLARTLAKKGMVDESFTAYLKLAEGSSKSALADDALLEAAQNMRSRNKWDAALQLLQKFVAMYPDSNLIKTVFWEIGWGSFQNGDFKTAAEYFHKLTSHESTRERGLYWQGRALLAGGDIRGAQVTYATLVDEYPLSYYALTCLKEAGIKPADTPLPPQDIAEALPMPTGFERIKALITLGFYEEAGKELSGQNKHKLQGIARLYLEMENYNGAISIFKKEKLRKLDKESAYLWGINYPLAFRDLVSKNSAANGVPESLIYSIIRAESTFSPTARSPVGAVGLMQLMPATAAAIEKGGPVTFDANRLTKPELNIRFGTKHLKDLLTLHNGDLILAIASYNAGSGNVDRWQKRFGKMPKTEFIENIPFAETREYVKKVLTGIEIYQRFYNLKEKDSGKTEPSRPQASPPA